VSRALADERGVPRVRVALPAYLRRLVGLPFTSCEVDLPGGAVTVGTVLAPLEARHPELLGVLRSSGADRVKPHLRVVAGRRDLTADGLDAALPAEVAEGREELRIFAAISGG
jgi:hypothetical protein